MLDEIVDVLSESLNAVVSPVSLIFGYVFLINLIIFKFSNFKLSL